MSDVLTLSLREFQLHATKYMDKTPIVLTQYGKPVLNVTTYEENVLTPVDTSQRPTVQQLKQTIGLKTADELKKPIGEWGNKKLYCQICHTSPAIYFQYNYTDGSGQGDGIFCQSHVEQYRNESKKKGDYQIMRKFTYSQPDFIGPFIKPKKKEKGK